MTGLAMSLKFVTDGMVQVAPDPWVEETDALVCSEAICGRCGHLGLRYNPFTRRGRRGKVTDYRIVAACPICDHAEEF